MTSDLQFAIRQAFEPIPEVEQAILAQSDDALKIFVVVDSDEDGSIYDRLYERERLLKVMLPITSCDFHSSRVAVERPRI